MKFKKKQASRKGLLKIFDFARIFFFAYPSKKCQKALKDPGLEIDLIQIKINLRKFRNRISKANSQYNQIKAKGISDK